MLWARAVAVCHVMAIAAPPARAQTAAPPEEPPLAASPLLASPLLASPELLLCEPMRWGCYQGVEGDWLDVDAAYAEPLEARRPNYLRTFSEMAFFLFIGTVWYWKNKDVNLLDWDRPAWASRFTNEAVRFDSNHHQTNFVWHAMSGSAFYGFARSNDLDVGSAFASAMLTSVAWEYILEFREKVSINDIIVTPGAGMAIGEFWHRLGRYLTSAPQSGGPRQRGFAWTFGLYQSFHDSVDRKAPPPEYVPEDNLGFDARLFHRFRSWFGYGRADHLEGSDFDVYELGFEGQFVAVPAFLRPSHYGLFFHDADFTQFRVRLGMSSEGTGVDLEADTILFGYHRQSIEDTGGGRVGNAVTVGSSTAYLYRREDYADWSEKQGIYSFPGASIDVYQLMGRSLLRISGRVHGDFVGIYSHAFPLWQDANASLPTDQQEVTKTPLVDHGYYFGWGWSARAEVELLVPYFEMGGRARYGHYNSRENRDRYQEDLTADFELSDHMLDYEVWLRVLPLSALGKGLYLEASLRDERRWSRADTYRVEDGIRRWQLTLGYEY